MISSLSAEARTELKAFIDACVAEALRVNREGRRWMTVRETATYLGTTEVAVRRRITRGRIVAKRMGGSVLVDREALDSQIAAS